MALSKTTQLDMVRVLYRYEGEGDTVVKELRVDWKIIVDDEEDSELPIVSIRRDLVTEETDREGLDSEIAAIAEAIWPTGSPE